MTHRAPCTVRQRRLLGCVAAAVLLALGTCAAPIQAQADDPVDDLQQSLALRPEDQTDLTETVVNFRRETLQKKIGRLRTLGQLRRALLLQEWKALAVDNAIRKEVGDRFIGSVQEIIKKGDPTARMAVANMIAEIGPSIRSLDPADRAGFSRSVTKDVMELAKDPSVEVRQEALRALGNINARPKDVFDVCKDVLEHDTLGPRRQAAAALGQMVRVVIFLKKQGQSNVQTTNAEVIDVARAAGAGASYGLADTDAQVRKLSLQALDESARAAWDVIPEPYKRSEFPPEARPLTKEERTRVQETQSAALLDAREVQEIFRAYQSLAPHLARNLAGPEVSVREEAARAFEDIANARLRLTRRVTSPPILSKKDEVERREMLRKIDPLAYFLQDNRLDVVTELLNAPEARLRRRAVDSLELLQEDAQPALPAIARALTDPDRFVRWAAARSIGNIGPRRAAPYAVELLGKLLGDNDDNVRLAASATLEAMGAEARAALPAMIEAIATGDADTRVAAMYILPSVGDENVRPAVPALIASLAAEDQRVRRAAADVLGRLGPVAAEAIPALRHALEDDDQETRVGASDALLAILAPRIP